MTPAFENIIWGVLPQMMFSKIECLLQTAVYINYSFNFSTPYSLFSHTTSKGVDANLSKRSVVKI